MKKINENYFKNTKQSEPASIESTLTNEEQVLWRGKPKKSAYILASIFKMLPIALLWLAFDVGAIVMICKTGDIPPLVIVFLCVFFAFHLLPVWIWITNIITAHKQHKNLEYAFTNQRIIIKSGIIGIDINNIYYSEIQSVNLKVGLTDKLLKVGDIYITSYNKSQTLFDIEDPYFIVNRLQKIVVDIKTDIEFPNNLRPSENKGYNTQYTGTNFDNKNL